MVVVEDDLKKVKSMEKYEETRDMRPESASFGSSQSRGGGGGFMVSSFFK